MFEQNKKEQRTGVDVSKCTTLERGVFWSQRIFWQVSSGQKERHLRAPHLHLLQLRTISKATKADEQAGWPTNKRKRA